MSDSFPCPCCGYLQFDEPPGSYDICAICFWEDDFVQLRWPTYRGGANRTSLVEAQAAFERVGACEDGSVRFVRAPGPSDVRDPDWRALSVDDRIPALDDDRQVPEDSTVLYWWRPTYWLTAG
jgi:hypothetical protein